MRVADGGLQQVSPASDALHIRFAHCHLSTFPWHSYTSTGEKSGPGLEGEGSFAFSQ